MRRFRFARTLAVHAPAGMLEAWVAESHTARLLGLAGLERLPAGRALLIPACRAVHTWGMRFALDVAFVEWPPSRVSLVHGLEENVGCRRFLYGPGRPAAGTAVLEAPGGTLRALGVGAGTALLLGLCVGAGTALLLRAQGHGPRGDGLSYRGGRAAAGPSGAACAG